MAKKEKKKSGQFEIRETKDYKTLILGGKGKDRKPSDAEQAEQLLKLLTPDRENMQLKQDTLKELKSESGKELLLKAIALSKDPAHTRIFTAACWEAGLDFSKYLSFFVPLALISGLYICLDVVTIIVDMQGPVDKKVAEESIAKLETARDADHSEKGILLTDMILSIQRFTA
jgi:hypothetical protein